MSLPTCRRSAGKSQAFDAVSAQDQDTLGLEPFEDGADDRLPLLRPCRCPGRGGDETAIVGDLYRSEAERGDDLSRMLSPGLLALGVEPKDDRIDADLLGNGVDYGCRQNFTGLQGAAEVSDEGQLNSEAETVVRAPVPLRQGDILGGEDIAPLRFVMTVGRIEQGGACCGRQDDAAAHQQAPGFVSKPLRSYLDGRVNRDILCGRFSLLQESRSRAVPKPLDCGTGATGKDRRHA
jgi:hypothetical protein